MGYFQLSLVWGKYGFCFFFNFEYNLEELGSSIFKCHSKLFNFSFSSALFLQNIFPLQNCDINNFSSCCSHCFSLMFYISI